MCRGLAALLLLTAPLQARQADNTPATTIALRAVLRNAGLRPIDSFEELIGSPADSALVVLGDPRPLRQLESGVLETLVREGAAVLIATDHPTGAETSELSGHRVHGRLLRGPPNVHRLYRNWLIDCPVVEPVARRWPFRRPRPLFEELTTVYANRPSYLVAADSGAADRATEIVARLPGNMALVEHGRSMRFPDAPLPFAVAGRIGRGQYLVIADHSLFIDGMMLQSDNANLTLAGRVAEWLADDGKRSRIVLLDEGQIVTDFSTRMSEVPDLPLPPLSALAPIVNQTIAGLEREDAFNQMALSVMPHGRWLGSFALSAAATSAALGLWALLRSRRAEPPSLPPARQSAAPTLGRSAAGRELAAAALAEIGLTPRHRPAPVAVAGPWWRRWTWGRELADLDRIANGRAVVRTDRQLLKLNHRLNQLRDAVRSGVVRPAPEMTP